MSCDGNLQQLQNTTINDTSASDQLSLSSSSNSACEPMFELEGTEFNEELLKAWLNDFSFTEIAPACSADNIQPATSSSANGKHSSNSSSGKNLQSLQQSTDNEPIHCNRLSPANMQPLLQSIVATPAKRIIKPRTQLSNQEIARLFLVYMSKALSSQQSASTTVNDKSKQGINSTSCLQAGNQASNTAKNTVLPSNQTSVQSLNSESTDLLQKPRTSHVARLRSTDSHQSTTECGAFKSKRKCRKSKSTGTSGTSSGSERVDYSVSVSRNGGTSYGSQRMSCGAFVSREVHRKSGHTKVRPYNSLDLPKVHDPLGLMDCSEDRIDSMQQPNASTGKVMSSNCGATATESSSCEMDLSPLVQILETVKTVPSFETTAKPNCNQKSPPTVKTVCNAKQKNKNKNVPESSDQVTPISDIFNTVNNLPNLLDIQSVLKYVQKRKAMRKLYRRRSHSAGSIDDLKKESKSSASLKAYTELLKANSHRLQRQLVPDQSLMNLQSCMTTHSTVTDNDFDFLRSIGIDPDRVTNDIKNDVKNLGDETQQDAQLQAEIPTDFDNLFHSRDSFLLQEIPAEGTDNQLCNSVQHSNVSNGFLPANAQAPVLQHTDILHLQTPMDAMNNNASELNHTSDNNASHKVYFTPEWAHTQGLIKVLIHGPFVSSSTHYVCYFGDLPVEAKMERWGILSCICPPATAPGFVTVKVTWEQKCYTCLHQFEYRPPSPLEPTDNSTAVSKENVNQSNLLHRINLLAKSCNASSEVESIMDENNHVNVSHWQFEQVVLHLLEKLRSVCSCTVLMELKPSYRTTVLHLAVLLNLENVIRKIKELVFSNAFPCSWESEFSAWTQDEEMCSPLMLSCQQGNVAISKLLLEWEPETITLTNFEGVTPVQCALQRGHASMVAELEEWILAISGNQTDAEMAESTESDIQQFPYSSNVYPMSSELYATDLEDILQSSNNDLLESHQLNASKEIKETAVLTKPSDRFLSMQNDSNTLNVDEYRTSVVIGESVSVDSFNFSPSPMFVTTNPCTAINDNSLLTVNELASGSSSTCNNTSEMPSLNPESLSYCTGNSSNFEHVFPISNADNISVSYSEPCPNAPVQFGDFRATSSPFLSSPSEPSSVISASPSSLSVSSDSCSVAEICELLGESPSVCQQDFSFPGLSDSEQQEIYHAARTIQYAFRKHKIQAQRHRHSKEKHAAVLIETYYKKYKEMKQMNQAAVLIQKYYRRYKNSLARSKELERAALFIQQMYRYQHHLRKH